MTKTILAAAAVILAGTLATADPFTDKIASDLISKGFDRIEIKNGPTQTKVEATDGTTKIEVVFDRNTGQIVKQETERLDAGDTISDGVSLRDENKDFVDDRSESDDRNDDHRGDDDDDHRSGDDDDDHEDHDDDHDDDDKEDKEDNSGHGGGDDD